MHISRHELAFGAGKASCHTSEASYLEFVRRANRPIEDAAFRTRTKIISKATHVNVGGITIATAAGSPIHFRTSRDPQYTFLVPIYGCASVRQGSHRIGLDSKSIVRCSYHTPLSFECGRSSAVTIRTSMPLLLNALGVADSDREKVTERLLDTDLEQLAPSAGGVDYYSVLRSLLAMIDAADCNERQLERIGYHRLLTGVLADLTLKTDRRLTDIRRRSPSCGPADIPPSPAGRPASAPPRA